MPRGNEGGGPQYRRSRSHLAGRDWRFVELRLLPEGFHLGARDVGEIGVLLARRALHFAEAAGEFGGGFFSGDFGVDVEEAGEVDGDEEDVAEFGFDAARW